MKENHIQVLEYAPIKMMSTNTLSSLVLINTFLVYQILIKTFPPPFSLTIYLTAPLLLGLNF